MARIRYYENPLKDEFEDFITEKENLKEVLEKLKIEDRPLSVTINEDTPDNLSLDTPLFKEDDVVIKRVVLGGPEGDSNKVLSTVIQLAAVIIAAASGVGAVASALIVAGGSIIAGVVRQAGFSKPDISQDRAEQKPAANAFSITSASNEARQLEPMKVVLGSHRVSPDYASQPVNDYFEQSGLPFENSEPIKNLTFVNVDLNGPSWNTIPAGWISNNIFNKPYYFFGPTTTSNHTQNPKTFNHWPYQLKVHPSVNLNDYLQDTDDFWIREVTTSAGKQVGSWPFQFGLSEGSTGQDFLGNKGQIAVPIYHSDPTDPFFGTYSNLEFLIWSVLAYYNEAYSRSSVYYRPAQTTRASFVSPSSPLYLQNEIQKIYGFLIGDANTISIDFGGDSSIANAVSQEGENIYRRLFTEMETEYFVSDNQASNSFIYDFFHVKTVRESTPSSLFWPPGVFSFIDPETFFNKDSLNGEARKLEIWNYVANLQNKFDTKAWLFDTLSLPVEPFSERVRHIFSYGIGDLEIQDRRIKDTPIQDYQESSFETGLMTSTGNILSNFYDDFSSVVLEEGADLINNDSNFSGPNFSVILTDMNDYNWIKRQTPANCKEFNFSVVGRSFKNNDDGTQTPLIANFEIQYKEINSPSFTFVQSFQLSSYKSNQVRRTLSFIFPSVGKYDIRVRKITKDPTDRRFLQEFSLKNFSFLREDNSTYTAQNREGFNLVASNKTAGTVDKYNALAESKCWAYTEVSPGTFGWVWTHTRNPAWWFLYFARGGFINQSNAGAGFSPDINTTISPTLGWVNSADTANNEERIFGAGFKIEEINIEKIIEWAEFCDFNNLKCDLVLQDDTSSSEVLEKIANIGRASVSFYQGLLSVVVEDPSAQPVGMYGMSNIIAGSFSIDYITNEVPQKIKGFYTDRDEDWTTQTVEAFVPGQTDVEKIVEVTLEGVTERQQAQREVNILAARQLYQRRRYGWKAGSDGLLVERGNLVYLSHDLTQYDFSGRISEFILNEDKTQVTGVRLPICIDETMSNMMLRLPNNRMVSFNISTIDKNTVNFDGFFDVTNAPENYDNKGNVNTDSRFFDSVPEDYLFFCGAQSALGKIVRIESISQDSNGEYDISAIEEEPALYAYEFDQTEIEPLESVRLKAVIESANYKILEEGLVEIFWDSNGAYAVEIRNTDTTLPLQSASGATIFGQKARFELIPNSTYNLEIIPVLIGQPYDKVSKKITVRT